MGAREELAARRGELERLEALAELEEQLAAAKDGGDEEQIREASLALREARAEQRENRPSTPVAEGDAAPDVPAVSAKAAAAKAKGA